MDQLTLIINTNEDTEKNKLMLGEQILPASRVVLQMEAGDVPKCIVEIPVVEKNMVIKIDETRGTDIEIIDAKAK